MSETDREILNLLTKHPSIGSQPSNVLPKTICFFKDDSWESERWDASIDTFPENTRQLVNSSAKDNTTWLAWNLPIGCVATLVDNYTPRDENKSIGDLRFLGRSIDLVGTGQVETASLMDCGMDDCVLAFFWRTVDFRFGAVEMFKDADFKGWWVTLFLSEWPANELHSLWDWEINDSMSSIKWHSLRERQKVVFWQHPEGNGISFDLAKGWGPLKEYADLHERSFNDEVSAFQWSPINPLKEEIEPITLKLDQRQESSISASGFLHNGLDIVQDFKIEMSKMQSETLHVSTTDEHVVGITVDQTTTAKGTIGVVEAEASLHIGLSYQYTKTQTVDTDKQTETGLKFEQTVKAKPHGTTTAQMIVRIGQVPEKTYKTTATRWYDQQLEGSQPDGVDPETRRQWYRRVEDTFVVLSGGVASTIDVDLSFKADKK